MTDAAVDNDRRLPFHGLHDFRQDLRRARNVRQGASAVIRHDDAVGTRLDRLQGVFHRHDPFYEEGLLRVRTDFLQVRDRFGAGLIPGMLPMAQACAVHHHAHGEGVILKRLHLPDDGGVGHGVENRDCIGMMAQDGFQRAGQHVRGNTVAEAVDRAGFCGSLHHAVIEGDRDILAAVLGHGADRAAHQRQGKVFPEQLGPGINRPVLGKGVEIQTDFLPCLPVDVRTVSGRLGARSRQGVPAAKPVALGTGPAVENGLACIFTDFLIGHFDRLPAQVGFSISEPDKIVHTAEGILRKA